MTRGTRFRHATAIAAVALLGMTACAADTTADPAAAPAVEQDDASNGLSADLTDRDGQNVGTFSLSEQNGMVRGEVSLTDLTLDAGFHGFHLHETAECDADAPDGAFTTAGGHWNPDDADHPEHPGDMPSLLVTEDGTAEATFVTDRFTFDDLPTEGVAVILHEDPDNYAHIPDRYQSEDADGPGPDETTLATGDAGDRYACATITP
ncbi:superoxide dismutase family protein [Streptomyces calidiresistens]|uniref:Superoxide dismutase [Cu-Zn] n=1 Tax=Streptomyces calidiresistens TaxID=1485586 RepID=A0A7W3T1B6_9ACTN|nr:superoxide dismutase family protein [Streptomyces calidiresistens]MBB0229082.1 superoxide dismutase family protein [Streptomyces calidiresistens]